MHNFHIKSILLGIGIGIVFTSVISMIYLAGTNPGEKMTKQEIIAQAKLYGMVDSTELIKKQTPKPAGSEQSAESPNPAPNTPGTNTPELNSEGNQDNDSSDDATLAQDPQGEQPEEVEVTIAIYPGNTSGIVAERLLAEGVVDDKEVFLEKLNEMGLETKIEIGEFKVKKGQDIKEVIRIITRT